MNQNMEYEIFYDLCSSIKDQVLALEKFYLASITNTHYRNYRKHFESDLQKIENIIRTIRKDIEI